MRYRRWGFENLQRRRGHFFKIALSKAREKSLFIIHHSLFLVEGYYSLLRGEGWHLNLFARNGAEVLGEVHDGLVGDARFRYPCRRNVFRGTAKHYIASQRLRFQPRLALNLRYAPGIRVGGEQGYLAHEKLLPARTLE